jgi:hypothetical protein
LLAEDIDDNLKRSAEIRLPIYNMCLTAAIEVKNVDKLIKFLSASEEVSKAFGGVGFKDISSGVDELFSLLNLKSASKKEFIQLISAYVSSGYSGKEIDPKDKALITSFLSTKTNGKVGYISRIINALGLRDTKQILSTIEYSNKKLTYVNLSVEDLDKAIRSLQLGGMNPESAAERWLSAAAFIHNHSTIPMNYIKRLLNSPNFLSDTKVSKEFIETCTALYLAGGINGLKNPTTTSGGVVVKLIESGFPPLKMPDQMFKGQKAGTDTHSTVGNSEINFGGHNYDFYLSIADFAQANEDRLYGDAPSVDILTTHMPRQYNPGANWDALRPTENMDLNYKENPLTPLLKLAKRGYRPED